MASAEEIMNLDDQASVSDLNKDNWGPVLRSVKFLVAMNDKPKAAYNEEEQDEDFITADDAVAADEGSETDKWKVLQTVVKMTKLAQNKAKADLAEAESEAVGAASARSSWAKARGAASAIAAFKDALDDSSEAKGSAAEVAAEETATKSAVNAKTKLRKSIFAAKAAMALAEAGETPEEGDLEAEVKAAEEAETAAAEAAAKSSVAKKKWAALGAAVEFVSKSSDAVAEGEKAKLEAEAAAEKEAADAADGDEASLASAQEKLATAKGKLLAVRAFKAAAAAKAEKESLDPAAALTSVMAVAKFKLGAKAKLLEEQESQLSADAELNTKTAASLAGMAGAALAATRLKRAAKKAKGEAAEGPVTADEEAVVYAMKDDAQEAAAAMAALQAAANKAATARSKLKTATAALAAIAAFKEGTDADAAIAEGEAEVSAAAAELAEMPAKEEAKVESHRRWVRAQGAALVAGKLAAAADKKEAADKEVEEAKAAYDAASAEVDALEPARDKFLSAVGKVKAVMAFKAVGGDAEAAAHHVQDEADHAVMDEKEAHGASVRLETARSKWMAATGAVAFVARLKNDEAKAEAVEQKAVAQQSEIAAAAAISGKRAAADAKLGLKSAAHTITALNRLKEAADVDRETSMIKKEAAAEKKEAMAALKELEAYKEEDAKAKLTFHGAAGAVLFLKSAKSEQATSKAAEAEAAATGAAEAPEYKAAMERKAKAQELKEKLSGAMGKLAALKVMREAKYDAAAAASRGDAVMAAAKAELAAAKATDAPRKAAVAKFRAAAGAARFVTAARAGGADAVAPAAKMQKEAAADAKSASAKVAATAGTFAKRSAASRRFKSLAAAAKVAVELEAAIKMPGYVFAVQTKCKAMSTEVETMAKEAEGADATIAASAEADANWGKLSGALKAVHAFKAVAEGDEVATAEAKEAELTTQVAEAEKAATAAKEAAATAEQKVSAWRDLKVRLQMFQVIKAFTDKTMPVKEEEAFELPEYVERVAAPIPIPGGKEDGHDASLALVAIGDALEASDAAGKEVPKEATEPAASPEPAAAAKPVTVASGRQFLESTIVPTLRQGLKQVVLSRPDNPYEFLAKYLLDNQPQP